MIDAKLAQEQLYEMKQLIDHRFGHGTWSFILEERKKRLDKRSIVVYSIPNHTAIDLIEGKNHFFIADKKLLENENRIFKK